MGNADCKHPLSHIGRRLSLSALTAACLFLSACNKTQQPPSAADYIGIAAAKEEALKAASCSSGQVFFSSAELEDKNGLASYKVVFSENDTEHIYEIDALTGAVIAERHALLPSKPATLPPSLPEEPSSPEAEEAPGPEQAPETPSASAPAETAPPTQPSSRTTPTQSAGSAKTGSTQAASAPKSQGAAAPSQASASSSSNSGEIDASTALSIALNHAGLTRQNISSYNTKTDYEDGQKVFEVEFYTSDGTEYEYDISAKSGAILHYDFEEKSSHHHSSHSGTSSASLISESQVRQIVLSRVPGASSSNMSIHLDEDDGQMEYEGELIYNNTEYEFKINAATGTIIEWEVEAMGR